MAERKGDLNDSKEAFDIFFGEMSPEQLTKWDVFRGW